MIVTLNRRVLPVFHVLFNNVSHTGDFYTPVEKTSIAQQVIIQNIQVYMDLDLDRRKAAVK